MAAEKQITVTIAGPQSSGKTMLAKAIADLLKGHDVPVHVLRDAACRREFARGRHRSEVVDGAARNLRHFPRETIVVIDDAGDDHA